MNTNYSGTSSGAKFAVRKIIMIIVVTVAVIFALSVATGVFEVHTNGQLGFFEIRWHFPWAKDSPFINWQWPWEKHYEPAPQPSESTYRL